MEYSVASTVSFLGRKDYGAYKYGVFVTYLNRDLYNDKGENTGLYGVMLLAGAYKSREKAEKQQSFISASTGAPSVIVAEMGKPIPLSLNGTDQTISYVRDPEESVREVQKNLERRRRDVEEIKARHEREVLERSDKSTVSYLIQHIYLRGEHAARQERCETTLKDSIRMEKEEHNLIVNYFKEDPGKLLVWKLDAKHRLKERGEVAIWEAMVKSFDSEFENIARDAEIPDDIIEKYRASMNKDEN